MLRATTRQSSMPVVLFRDSLHKYYELSRRRELSKRNHYIKYQWIMERAVMKEKSTPLRNSISCNSPQYTKVLLAFCVLTSSDRSGQTQKSLKHFQGLEEKT